MVSRMTVPGHLTSDQLALDRVIVRLLARVHPLNVSLLLTQFQLVLTGVTGIGLDHPVFAPISTIRTVEELAQVDWPELSEEICLHTCLSASGCALAVAHAQLFAERAILQHRLFLSKSASTLRLIQGKGLTLSYRRPELAWLCGEFDRALAAADRALHAGRGCMQEFQQIASHGDTLSRLPALLERAEADFFSYVRLLRRASELSYYIHWYLSWTPAASTGGEWEASYAA